MNQDQVKKIDFSDEFLLDSAERKMQSGDYYGALKMLHRRNELYDMNCDAAVLAADIYESMGIYSQAADAWFHFLDVCNEADFSEGYEGLAVAFMNLGSEAQSALYYHKMLVADNELTDENRMELLNAFTQDNKPHLRLVHSDDSDLGDETIAHGIELLQHGDLEAARSEFKSVSPDHKEYASAVGLAAMCSLMQGDLDTAEKECEQLYRKFPDNIQVLTSYCAVLSEQDKKEEAKEVAKHLADLTVTDTEDLYKVATALCETGLNEPAERTLSMLLERLPYDKNILYFYAISAYRVGKVDEAIATLERLCLIYPNAAVAEYYLEQMRKSRDDGTKVATTYYYRVPERKYAELVQYFAIAQDAKKDDRASIAEFKNSDEYFAIAFDELDGRDEKLATLAADTAVLLKKDTFIRNQLINYQGNDFIKFVILHALTVRNEENSFGTVICHLYKEFFTHKLQLGTRKRKPFLMAFADVYSKFALLGDEEETKIVEAGESVYYALADYEAWGFMDDRAELAAVIYRESHLSKRERGIDNICALFDAKKAVVEEILTFIL